MAYSQSVDGGYSWVVLVCCGINYVITVGSVKAFGVVYTEFLDYFGTGAGNTAWISSVCICLMFSLGPFSNFLGEKYTYRVVMVTGSCLVLFGFTASAFVPRMEYLFLTYGLIVGTGFGLIFPPCSTIISFYFDKKRGLANGLMVAFSGMGGFGFPYMYRWLFDSFGLRNALMLTGALFFHSAAASLCLRQPHLLIKQEQLRNNKHNKSCFSTVVQARKRILKLSLFKNSKFTIYFLAIVFQTCNFNGNLVAMPGQAYSLGLGKTEIALAVSIFGAVEIIARTFLGWFSDLKILKRTTILMLSSLFSSLIAFVIPLVLNVDSLLVYAGLMGAFSGTVASLMGIIIFDCVGIQDFSPGFGLLALTLGLTVFIAQPPVGWLKDRTGHWGMSFQLLGVFSFISFLLCATEPLFSRLCNKTINNTEEKIEKQTSPYEIGIQITKL